MIFTAGGYVNLMTDQIVASGIKSGAVSLLAYSQFLLMLPYTLVFLASWSFLLVAWIALDLPLGPGAGLRLAP